MPLQPEISPACAVAASAIVGHQSGDLETWTQVVAGAAGADRVMIRIPLLNRAALFARLNVGL